MENMKKVLVIGDYNNAPYHPLSAIEKQLESILSEEFLLKSEPNYSELDYNDFKNYQTVISYTDCWESKPTVNFSVGLLSYIINGGSLLLIHNGISLQNKYELAQMIGAKFTRHPERTTLAYVDFNCEHPITKGINEFSLYEEPYQFEVDPFAEKTELFSYVYEGNKYPAAWVHNYGKGKVVYLSPGHDSAIFDCAEYRNIIKNSVSWLNSNDFVRDCL
jgi:uncharacterized protein